jgi:hypothetical protein
VVVAFDMARELPRTLRSLDPRYQQGMVGDEYEVIVVDNGSSPAVDRSDFADFGGQLRVVRIDDAPASPARAANEGISRAGSELVGLVVDGARLASPGLLAGARRAGRVPGCSVIATLGWHLGDSPHMEVDDGDERKAQEDRLLRDIDWEHDGYRLFEVSRLGGSSARGWFGPLGESSALFLRSSTWDELGGLDESFALPGGGLVNHDLLRRAVELAGSRPVILLGEGTFHQFHGGAATSGRFSWEEMAADYRSIRGSDYRPPTVPPLFVGPMPTNALGQLSESLARAGDERVAIRYDGW